MKVPLMLGILLCAWSSRAQAQYFPAEPCYTAGTLWYLQNQSGRIQTPPLAVSERMHTVDGRTAWQLLSTNYDNRPYHLRGYGIARTTDWGQSWQYQPLSGGASIRVRQLAPTSADSAFLIMETFGQGNPTLRRTTDGGATWTTLLTTVQLPRAPSIHFFTSTEGVVFGTASAPGTGLAVLRTTDGGATWAAVPAANLPAAVANEAILSEVVSSLDNTLWILAADVSQSNTGLEAPVRILRSTDRGRHWTASATLPRFSVERNYLSFASPSRGLLTSMLGSFYSTIDGGATWQPISRTGPVYYSTIKAIHNTGTYLALGFNLDAGGSGVSQSFDGGRTWWGIAQGVFFASFAYANATTGYFGAYTDAAGAGGVYRTVQAALSSRSATSPAAFQLYPNPNAGRTVYLQTGAPAGTQLRVCDLLGRQVYARTLSASFTGQVLALDLPAQARGLYLVSLTSGQYTQQQHLVLE